MNSAEGIDHIYRDGRHYDHLFVGENPDLAFWAGQAEKHGDPVLELACGTGRVTIALARQGFKMTGLDNSAAMLNEARRKSAAANVEVEWIEYECSRAMTLHSRGGKHGKRNCAEPTTRV